MALQSCILYELRYSKCSQLCLNTGLNLASPKHGHLGWKATFSFYGNNKYKHCRDEIAVQDA